MAKPTKGIIAYSREAASIWRIAKSTGRAALDLVLPAQCLLSREIVRNPGEMRPERWADLNFIAAPQCDCCGSPFPFDPGEGVICPACARHEPLYNRARAPLVYDDRSARLVTALKHADRLDGVAAFGRWMTAAGRDILNGADLLAPVPLHYSRLLKRRFNQSVLLAQAVAAQSGVSLVPDLLTRTRPTGSQKGRDWRARRLNVAKAFSVRAKYGDRLKGCRVVLVDDVLTTGATVEACAKVLIRAGVQEVDILTLARVVAVNRRAI